MPSQHPHSAIEPLLILGETTFRRQHQRFGLLPQDRLRHLWVIGKTGAGKSTLLANLICQDIQRGEGLALLDPHGDLVETVLPFVPKHRVGDVLLFSPADREYPVSFNVFRQGRRPHADTALLTSQLVSIFKKYWADSWGPRLEHVLRNAILAVAPDPRATLLFLYRFLTDEKLRAKVTANISDPVVRQFWLKEFPGYGRSLQSEAVAPALNKLGAFVAHPIIRNIVGQVRSRVDLIQLMNSRGILLANLATGQIGEDASHLLGGLLLTALQLSAMERARGGAPIMVYVDEFQHFVTDSIATLLSESRKFGLGLILAHQYLAQLTDSVRDAVLGNVGSMMVFRIGASDAELLESEFSPPFTASDLMALPRYHAAVKVLARGEALAPFSARTLAALSSPADAAAVITRIHDASRRRFGRARQDIDRVIALSMGVSVHSP